MSSDADASGEMSMDLVFEILSNTRRRMVLYYLRQHDESITVQELAEQIAAMENEVAVEDLGSQQRKRVYVSLYQTHIPKLQETGIVEYDEETGEVSLTDRAGEVDEYLTSSTTSRYPWQLHYLALAIAGGALFVLSSFDVFGPGTIPTLWVGVGLVLAFAVSAVVQYARRRASRGEIPEELAEYRR